jgi:DNA-binding LytR/AlgR family response regulator
MEVVIIEDEILAADRLRRLLHQYDPSIKVIGHVDSVKEAITWFESNKTPDLAFMDIQLGDGLIFKLFDKMEITCPVIFTTAYDTYAVKAFKVFSVDYLLKPIGPKELKDAIDKFKQFNYSSGPRIPFNNHPEMQEIMSGSSKSRFVVKIGDHIQSIPVENIFCFSSDEKVTFLHTESRKKYIVEYSLEQLENMLKPELFFRVNRKYIININSISDIVSYTNNRLKVFIKDLNKVDVIVSREKVAAFKIWLNG